MTTLRIIHGGPLATFGIDGKVYANGAVVIRGDRVEAVGPADKILAKYEGGTRHDVGGRLILPGLVNAHMHLYSTFSCGISSAPSKDFTEILEHLWWRLDKVLLDGDHYYSAIVPLARAVKAGCTCLIDHHASPSAVDGSLDELARAVTDVGIRADLCYEVSDRDGPEVARSGIAENARFARRVRDEGLSTLRAHMGLHASFTVSDETLAAAVHAAKDTGVGVHVHTAEDAADQRASLADHGKRVITRLGDAGALGEQSVCVHGVHLDEAEMELLASTGTWLAHNPQSNMNNAVGVGNVPELMARGVKVVLGSDGMTSNIFEELRAASFVARHQAGDPGVGWGEPVTMLTETNPALASHAFGIPVGTLEPGAAADVAVMDYIPYTPLSADNLGGHLVFGVSQTRAHLVVASGRVLLEGGQLVTIDEARLTAEALAKAEAIWKRY